MTDSMKKWFENYFSEQWKEVTVDIDFSDHEPISTSNSLHIYEERYEINGDTYRLLYGIGVDGDPNVEKLIKKVVDKKATEALQFYEDCADGIANYQTSKKDNGFDWDRCRAFCSVGKSYSHSRFMAYVAEWFGTTVKEMKTQWNNIKEK